MEILPAILPKNFRELEEKVESMVGIADVVQVDICDGKFVPSTTWPYWKPDENFEQILREERGMPHWEDVNYEFDLMVNNPDENEARKWLSAGAERVVLHHHSSPDLTPAISVLQGLVEIGIAVNTTTNLEEIKKYADRVQFIQVMGIRKAGFQGQKFEPSTIDKVKEVKAMFPNLKVQVDGGVSLENADLLKNAGADRLVVGSALFTSENIAEEYQNFKAI